jgi:methylenetetrahydrofolate reductase (NADPH)
MKIADILEKKMTLSFEVFPPKEDDGVPKLQSELDILFKYAPDFISCTYGAGGTNVGKSQVICKYIQDHSVNCMTHFTCIGTGTERIEKEMAEYKTLGVENVLALRGDFPRDPATGKLATKTGGAFDYANQLIEFIKAKFPELCVSCAGDPEIHITALSEEADIAYIRAKQDAGAEFIMCQLTHDIDGYSRWVEKLRRAGVRIPVVMGLMPVLSRDPIINMSLSNGSSIPKDLARIIGTYTPPRGAAPEVAKEFASDFEKAGMEYTTKSLLRYMNTDLQGIHLYALNKASKVAQIVEWSGLRQAPK